ncbi:hypothetical protein [Nocardia brasiliensis]|uniref:hypothetical protein n=1 Tax=Nocardia brasiliensis TaxID=37326 RepID=UPI00245865CE|nr:hypothetical protein [Nocardia brasiliensis]
MPWGATHSVVPTAVVAWDPARWQPTRVRRRFWSWVTARRARYRTVSVLTMLFVLFVFPGILGAVVTAQTGSGLAGTGYSALSWTDVRDSAGVPVANYMFVTDHGGILSPWNTAMSVVISLEFAGWSTLIGFGNWIVGTTISFSWADRIGAALAGVADSIIRQLPLPAMLAAGTALGVVFVAMFIVRGQFAKAAMQVVVMFGVAVGGPLVLAHPLQEVVASDGVLAQGRDLGVALAAGLLGDNDPNPAAMTKSLQGRMADHTVRWPLQTWNFGHVVDTRPLCKSVWSNGMINQSEKQVKEGLTACGDTVARAATDNPTVGQIAAGFLLIIVGGTVMWFGVSFAFRVFWAMADAIYNALVLLIWDIPMTGFIYGRTQISMVRRIVDTGIAMVRMVANIVKLAFFLAFFGRLMEQSADDGDVMLILVLGAIVMVVGTVQLKRMNERLTATSVEVAGRIGRSIESGGVFAPVGAGSGGGMGLAGLGNSLPASSGSFVNKLAALSVVASSPLTEWMFGGMRQPFRPYAGLQRAADISAMERETTSGLGGARGWAAQGAADRSLHEMVAQHALENAPGGMNTVRGAAAVRLAMDDAGLPADHVGGVFHSLGWEDMEMMNHQAKSFGNIQRDADRNPGANPHIALLVAAYRRVQSSARRISSGAVGAPSAQAVAADYAALQGAAFRNRRAIREDQSAIRLRTLADYAPGNPLAFDEQAFVDRYLGLDESVYSRRTMQQLQQIADGENPVNIANLSPHLGTNVSRTAASRMMHAIAEHEAENAFQAVDAAVFSPNNPALLREARHRIWITANTSHWQHDIPTTAYNAPREPDFLHNRARTDFGPRMDEVAELLRERR